MIFIFFRYYSIAAEISQYKMLCLGLFRGRRRKKFTFGGSSGRSLRNFSWFVYKLFTIKRSISGILKAQRMLVLRRTGA